MTDKAVQYYLDKDQKVDIRIDCWSHGRMHVSIYNDRNDTSVGYTCNRDELRGLADFIYESIGEKKFAGLRNGKIVEFSSDRLSLNHDHIDQIVEIELDKKK